MISGIRLLLFQEPVMLVLQLAKMGPNTGLQCARTSPLQKRSGNGVRNRLILLQWCRGSPAFRNDLVLECGASFWRGQLLFSAGR